MDATLTTRLLQESDQYAEMMFWDHNCYESDFEDSFSEVSSGYESTGFSTDSQSLSSEESRVTPHEPIRNDYSGRTQFQNTAPLCNSLELILSMPEFCDVTFLVGPEQVPVHGVKAIMVCRSRKMYELILKHQNMKKDEDKRSKSKSKTSRSGVLVSEKLTIPVKKYDAAVFTNLIQFIHCGTVTITDKNVAGLFCGASQFELQDLEKACLDYVDERVRDRDVTSLLSSTRRYSHHKAATVLFDKIYEEQDKRVKKYREISV